MLWPIFSNSSPILLALNFVRRSTYYGKEFDAFGFQFCVTSNMLIQLFQLTMSESLHDKSARRCVLFVKKFTKFSCGTSLDKMNRRDKCSWYFHSSYGIATVKLQSNSKRVTGTRLPCSVRNFFLLRRAFKVLLWADICAL